MSDRFTRVRWLLGDKFNALKKARVLVCGAGGVGGMCADALARSGVGEIVLVDKDSFDITNQNRQIHSENEGAIKVAEFAKRYANITPVHVLVDDEFIARVDFGGFNVVIDCIDDMGAKIALALASPKHKFIASMGGAKRLDASQVIVDSVWKSYGDPFARKYRSELKRAGFKGDFKVVFSPEAPACKELGSFMGVTAVFGLNLASLALRMIVKSGEEKV